MRTHTDLEGVGPSKRNSICQPESESEICPTVMEGKCSPGGVTARVGAVTVHDVPEHVTAGKIVRPPMVFPCVLDVAMKE